MRGFRLVVLLLVANPEAAFCQYIPAATGWSTTAGSANGQTQTATTGTGTYVTLDTLDFTVSPGSSGFFTADSSLMFSSAQNGWTYPGVRYLLDGAPLGNANISFTSLNGMGFPNLPQGALPVQAMFSGLAPGNHQLSLQWNSGEVSSAGGPIAIAANSRSFHLTSFNSVGGQPAAVGWSTSAGSADGFTQTATFPSGNYTNLQTINFTTNAASSGLYNASSTVVLGQGIQSPFYVRLRYLLDGSPYGNESYLFLQPSTLQAVTLPAQISGLSLGDHELSLQWARVNTQGNYRAYSQSMQLTGFNTINGVSAAQGWSVSAAGNVDPLIGIQGRTATTNSTSYVDLQTINFTADALTTGLFDVAGSLVLANNTGTNTVGLRYLLDGVQIGPGFTNTLYIGSGPQPFSFPLQFSDVLQGDHVFKVQWASFSGGRIDAFSQFFSLTGYTI